MRLVEPGRGQAVVAALVEHEPGVDDARPPLERGDDLFGARHLRHAGRIHEADNLDARQPGGGEPPDELCAHRRLEHGGVVLEAVARSDVAHRHAAHMTPSCFSAASSSSERPSSSP